MATMKDVAAAAGVSVATVSNYINNTKSVSIDFSEKIADAIEQLHYVPNQMAKNLKSNNSNNIGVILPNIQDSYYVKILQGIEYFLNEKGYCIDLGISNDIMEIEQKHIYNFLKKMVRGFIIITSQPDNTDFFENNIIKKEIPFVHIDRKIDIQGVSFLTFDNKKTFESLTSYFLKNDKRNITLIAGADCYSCEKFAEDGYINSFKTNNIAINYDNILKISLNKEAAFRTTVLHLQDNKPDVILTTSKLVTQGVLESLAVVGYNVPEDIVVATLGDDNWNRLYGFKNTITTSRQSNLLGRKAAKLLFSQIQSYKTFEPQTVVLEDKYNTSNTIVPNNKHNVICKDKLKVIMLDTLQTNLFEGLIPHFKNAVGTDVNITKIPHQQLLKRIYDERETADVFMLDMPWLFSLAKDGIILDITKQIEGKGFNKEIYLKDCLEYYGKFQNKYYALPFMYAPQILFYRKDIFQNRAIKNEFKRINNFKLQPPRTWTEFNTIARFFTKSNNKSSPTLYGTAVPASYKECLMPEIYMRMRAYGSQIYNKKFKVVFNSRQTIKAYESFMQLVNNSVPDCTKFNDMAVVDEFLKGNIAMLITYPSFISDINDLQKNCLTGKVGFSHIPGRSPVLGGWSLGISRCSKNKEQAFSFINWACGEEMANYFTIMAGQSAIAKTFDNNELISLYPWLPLYKNVYEYSEPVIPPYKRNKEIIPQEKIDEIISNEVYRMLSGQTSIENAILITQVKLMELFDEYGYKN